MSTPAEDLEEIRTLLARYCFAIDAKDAAGFSALFTGDGVFDFKLGPPVQGREALREFVAGIPDDRHHVTTNEIIELDGDRATVRAYALVTKESPPVISTMGGTRTCSVAPRRVGGSRTAPSPATEPAPVSEAVAASRSVMLGGMGSPSITVDLILEAARTAIAERGPGKLTLSAVASAAGISRPTLYRWFPTKTDLLAAIAAYEEERFDIGLQLVIDAHRAPRRRLDAALRYLVNYLDDSLMPDPIGIDPEYALKGLQASMGPHTEILARLLGDALLEVPAVRAGVLTREQAAELFLRMAYSHYLVPHPDTEVLLAMMRDLAGISPRAARLMAG